MATNRQLLRLYTPAGRCGALLSLPGPVVALAARDHLLAVVTAGLPNWANSGQQLHYQVRCAARVCCSEMLATASGRQVLGVQEERKAGLWQLQCFSVPMCRLHHRHNAFLACMVYLVATIPLSWHTANTRSPCECCSA